MTDRSDLKYRLDEMLERFPRNIPISRITDLLEQHYDIQPRAFFRHRKILKNSASTISEEDLAKYARFFGVHENELRNYDPTREKHSLATLLKLAPRQLRADLEQMTGMVPSR